MACEFSYVVFEHCYGEQNCVAHELAKFSFCNKSDDNWIDEPPGFLISQLVNDVVIL